MFNSLSSLSVSASYNELMYLFKTPMHHVCICVILLLCENITILIHAGIRNKRRKKIEEPIRNNLTFGFAIVN